MDPLDRLIQLANLQGRLDQRCQLQGSWALEHPQAVPGEATFHIVMAGTCYCEFLDGGRLDLHPGDLILLPRGTPHLLRSDSPAQPCEPTVEHRGSIPLYQLNGPGEALDMLCGSYRYHAGASLFGALPERLLVHMDESTQQPLRALIGLMREEAESTRSGARSIIDALATALFALALRAYLDRQPLGDGLFGLLGDARLGRALRAMLERLEHAWTLEQLAQQAAMSRASFVRAFSALGGTSPWNLLTRIRMEKARGLLRQTQKSLLDIAAETGYQSEAAFSRNFRQAFGESPGRFRRQADPAR
ncbi:TPA: AraC family transcriptional regulator [Pseudomonas aeruginosa]